MNKIVHQNRKSITEAQHNDGGMTCQDLPYRSQHTSKHEGESRGETRKAGRPRLNGVTKIALSFHGREWEHTSHRG